MPLQDAKLNWGPIHANSNVICAIDIRVDGTDPKNCNLLEVCFLPLNHSYKPHKEFGLFNIKLRPSLPVDLKFANISKPDLQSFVESPFDSIESIDLFMHWCENTLLLKQHKRVLPLVWNYPAIQPHLKEWLGETTFNNCIHESYRDLNVLLNFINDRADYHGKGEEIPYKHPTFEQLLVRSGITLLQRNSLIANCKAMSDAYRHLLHRR